MWRLKRQRDGDTAVADRPPGDFAGTDEELFAEIERLSEAHRSDADRDIERRLLRLRHLAGIRVLNSNGSEPEHPVPDYDALPEADGLPDIPATELTPGLLRAGILRDGCLLVRGLVPREEALRFAAQIDRSFAERERADDGEDPADGYYEPFRAEAPYETGDEERNWIKAGGGVLAADAPMLSWEMIELFRAARLPQLVERYLGERPLISVEKTTLRKAEPSVAGGWHQDGKFMGKVRSLNLWLSLSRCGDEAPGLDLVPRRLDEMVTTQTDEAMLDYQVSRATAEEAAGHAGILRPVFEPGDALFFDEMFLHSTASDPAMPNPRFAIENWFFGGSSFPQAYGPLAV